MPRYRYSSLVVPIRRASRVFTPQRFNPIQSLLDCEYNWRVLESERDVLAPRLTLLERIPFLALRDLAKRCRLISA